MGWNEIYKDMVFAPDKDEYAKRMTVKDAVNTLAAYLGGQEREGSVLDALKYLEGEFSGLNGRCEECRQILEWEDFEQRYAALSPQFDGIAGYIRSATNRRYLS